MVSDGKIQQLERYLRRNKNIQYILEKAPILKMPNWHLAAGCVAQTVWNINYNYDPCYGIKDYNVIYCDNSDISYESEDYYIQKGKELFKETPVEIRNQARVYLWHEKHFGYPYRQYQSIV